MAKRDGVGDRAGARRPKMVVALGRGKTGKSVYLTWLAEAAQRDFPLRIIDADPNNPVLSHLFPEAEMPPAVDGADRRLWLEQQFDRLMAQAGTAEQHDLLLDVGGNDMLLKRLGSELHIADVLLGEGVDPVAVHMLGPDEADLRYLEDVERHGLFCPPMTILVLNRGLVGESRSYAAAFGPILESDVVKRVLSPERGGRMVVMPELGCMRDIESKGVTPRAALERCRELGLGIINRTRIRNWLERDMPAMREPVADWLP